MHRMIRHVQGHNTAAMVLIVDQIDSKVGSAIGVEVWVL